MFTVFIVIQILLTLALVGLILVQRNDSDGLGSMGGGGGGNAFMTGRGAANFMTRSTAIIATLFMLNSLLLGVLASNMADRSSLAEEIENTDEATVSVPLADEPAAEKPAKVTDPKPLTPEFPVITTEEPSGAPVTAEPAPAIENAAPAAEEVAPAEAAEETGEAAVPTP